MLASADPGSVADEGQEPDGGASIPDAIRVLLLGVRGTRSKATFKAYEGDLRWFRERCPKAFAAQVGRQDILALFAPDRSAG